jgi:hypothetical protein
MAVTANLAKLKFPLIESYVRPVQFFYRLHAYLHSLAALNVNPRRE